MRPQSLDQWLAYLEQLHPKTIALGLERTAEVKHRLGLHPTFPIITVAGTNGKGSLCALLEAMLHAAGYRVGCYTSPHLLDYNERVRIGKQALSDAELCAAFDKIEQVRGDIHVASYHANLIYNAGAGTAADLRALIAELKSRVAEKFGITLEEEVQYVGFPDGARP